MKGPGEQTTPICDTTSSARRDDVAPAEAAELLAAVFDSTVAGLAVLSGTELRFERANPAFRALVARPDLDPAGLRFEEFWPSSDPVILPALRRALATGEPCHTDDYPQNAEKMRLTAGKSSEHGKGSRKSV